MPNKIIPFNYGDNLIRVVNDETTGEPLWIAKDVCIVLGIIKYRDALAKLDEDERVSLKMDTLGGQQNMSFVNESGLYNLIFRSNKPEAKPFKRWVTHEVLPSIRKTGSYGNTQNNDALNQIMPVLHTMVEMMKQMMEMQMQMMRQMQQQQIEHKKESLTPEQLDKIKIAANKAAKALADCHNFTWGVALKEVYSELNGRMGVFAYYHIAPSDYKEALELLKRMKEVKEQEAKTGKPVRLALEIIIGGEDANT